MSCERCGLALDPVAQHGGYTTHPACDLGPRSWPPAGFRLARGEGPAKAEYEAHIARGRSIEDAYQQRPRGRQS